MVIVNGIPSKRRKKGTKWLVEKPRKKTGWALSKGSKPWKALINSVKYLKPIKKHTLGVMKHDDGSHTEPG